jgi:hypothetical protein
VDLQAALEPELRMGQSTSISDLVQGGETHLSVRTLPIECLVVDRALYSVRTGELNDNWLLTYLTV